MIPYFIIFIGAFIIGMVFNLLVPPKVPTVTKYGNPFDSKIVHTTDNKCQYQYSYQKVDCTADAKPLVY